MELDKQKAFLYSGAGLLGAVCFLMISSFLGYLLTGLLLAFVSKPLYDRLNDLTRSDFAAISVIFVTVFAAILPFTLIIGTVGGEAAGLVSNIDSSRGLELVGEIESQITELTGRSISLEAQASDILDRIASSLPSSFSAAASILSSISIGLSVMLFIQFYALKDGNRFVDYTKKFDFMDESRQNNFYDSTAKSIWAVVKGHVLIAFAQGVLSGIGLYIAGVPNVFFWTFVMVLLGFIPLVGTALVWIPAAVYLMFIGNTLSAVFLVLYGLIVVGASDNILRPLAVDKEADIHPIFILVGLIGGIGLFGPIGIFLGPVLFGVLKNFLDMILDLQ